MDIEVPQACLSEFEPQVVKKRQKDISDSDRKIISVYAEGLGTKTYSESLMINTYGFKYQEVLFVV